MMSLNNCNNNLCQEINEFFAKGKTKNFSPDEYKRYEISLKYYRDLKNSLETMREEGLAEGLAKGRKEGEAKGRKEGLAEGLAKGEAKGRIEERLAIAKHLKLVGLSLKLIKQTTGLSDDELKQL